MFPSTLWVLGTGIYATETILMIDPFKWPCKRFNMTNHQEHYLQSCWLSPHSHWLSCGFLHPHTQLSFCGILLLIQSYIIDHSILTGIKVHSCCLIHHNSWWSHQSVGHLQLQLEYTSLHRSALHLYTMYKINSESWSEYNWKVLTGQSM